MLEAAPRCGRVRRVLPEPDPAVGVPIADEHLLEVAVEEDAGDFASKSRLRLGAFYLPFGKDSLPVIDLFRQPSTDEARPLRNERSSKWASQLSTLVTDRPAGRNILCNAVALTRHHLAITRVCLAYHLLPSGEEYS